MKEIFNFKRFGKFFLYDLRNSKNYFWLSLLICAALPFVCFFFEQSVSRIFFGRWVYEGLPLQIVSVICAVIVVMFTYPVKAYGKLTDKRAGSSWLMIPASSVEKTLSMILVSCVVLPVAFFGLLTGVDALMGVVFPNMWPEPLICKIWKGASEVMAETEGVVHINFPGFIWYSWASNILTFILGSIFFKKAKIGKTFLALFILGQAMSVLCSVILLGTPAFADIFQRNFDAFDNPVFALKMLKNFNWFFAIYCWSYFVLIIGLLWARVKTMKH